MGPEIQKLAEYRASLSWWRRWFFFPMELTNLLRDKNATDYQIFEAMDRLSKKWTVLSEKNARMFFDQPRVFMWKEVFSYSTSEPRKDIFDAVSACPKNALLDTVRAIEILKAKKMLSANNVKKCWKPGAFSFLKYLSYKEKLIVLDKTNENSNFYKLEDCLKVFDEKGIKTIDEKEYSQICSMESEELRYFNQIMSSCLNFQTDKSSALVISDNQDKIEAVIGCKNKEKLWALIDEKVEYQEAILAVEYEDAQSALKAINRLKQTDKQYKRAESQEDLDGTRYRGALKIYKNRDPQDLVEAIIHLLRYLPKAKKCDFMIDHNNSRIWVCLEQASLHKEEMLVFVKAAVKILNLHSLVRDININSTDIFAALRKCRDVTKYAEAVKNLETTLVSCNLSSCLLKIATKDFFINPEKEEIIQATEELCRSGVLKNGNRPEYSLDICLRYIEESDEPLELVSKILSTYTENPQLEITHNVLKEFADEISSAKTFTQVSF